MRLAGKVAVITGAGSGFGEGMAKLFATEGARVVVADINDNAGHTVTQAIADAGGEARFQHADVTKRDEVRGMLTAATESYGRLDILVNNAGYSHYKKPMLEVTEEEFDRIYDVNVKAIYLAALESLPIFQAQGDGGCIINTTSTAGLRPRPGLTVYNGSKGAANVMTKSMAVEFAPDKVRVNAICPVAGETAMLETFLGGPDTPENRAPFLASIPLGRLSRPNDVARAALYLASDEAEFITGVTLEVDGGRCV